eukprot:UN05397
MDFYYCMYVCCSFFVCLYNHVNYDNCHFHYLYQNNSQSRHQIHLLLDNDVFFYCKCNHFPRKLYHNHVFCLIFDAYSAYY